ncbi:MAG: hypothetical protein KA063_01500 [Firmicutes bacterium]|jgi:hypothetical protein|nr:hypothetical protein [Bacillota bacterium]
MTRSANKAAAVLVAMALLCFAGHAAAQSATVSPVERLVAMEGLLFGAQQQGAIVARLQNIENVVFGESGSGTLPERLDQCWNFVLGDRAGGMNLKFKLKAVQWKIFGKITDGPVVPMLVDLENSVIGQPGLGPIGPRLDILMRLSIPGGRPEVGYSLVPKGSLVKVKLLTPLGSVKARSGDIAKFEVVDDVVFEDRLVIPKGTPVTARVIDTLRPTKMGIKARVDLELQPLDAIDSGPVVLGVEQTTIAANSAVSLTAGEGIRVFGIVGKEGALGGLLSQNPELEIAEGVELFFSVMQTAKVLGLAVPKAN